MFLQSKNPVFKRTLGNEMLSALSARPAAALLVTPFVHLFTAGPSPITPDTVIADFTEATFTGYAAQALTLPLLGPVNLADSTDAVEGSLLFLAGAVVAPGENCLGYWIDEAAAGGVTLYMSETFNAPVQFAVAGDFLSIALLFAKQLMMSLSVP